MADIPRSVVLFGVPALAAILTAAFDLSWGFTTGRSERFYFRDQHPVRFWLSTAITTIEAFVATLFVLELWWDQGRLWHSLIAP